MPAVTKNDVKLETVNATTIAPAATGFTIAGGTTSKTLTVDSDFTTSAVPAVIVYASAAEITTGTEAAKAIAPDQAKLAGLTDRWVTTTGTFTATPVVTVIGTVTFTFAASTAVTASADCLAQGVVPGAYIYNSTDDARAAAKQILSISENGIDIVLAAAYAGTTGAAKQGTIFGNKLTMTTDLTGSIKSMMSLELTIGGVAQYNLCKTMAAGSIEVYGPALSGDVTSFRYGGGTSRFLQIGISGTYEDASNTALILSDRKEQAPLWRFPVSYCVWYSVFSITHDSTTHGQGSIRINNTEVNTATGGLYIAADATAYGTGIDIAKAAYDINPGEAIEATAVKAGAGDATHLTIAMVFVTP